MEETINLLLEEINSNLKEMKGLSKSSDEYGNIVSDTGKLLDKVTPMIRIKEEADERAKNREEDLAIQEKIRKEEADERARIREEDREERKINREEDNAFKIESEKKNLFIEGVKIAVPVATTVLLLLNDNKLGNKLLKFEETGTLTTTIGRNFFSSIGRKKK